MGQPLPWKNPKSDEGEKMLSLLQQTHLKAIMTETEEAVKEYFEVFFDTQVREEQLQNTILYRHVIISQALELWRKGKISLERDIPFCCVVEEMRQHSREYLPHSVEGRRIGTFTYPREDPLPHVIIGINLGSKTGDNLLSIEQCLTLMTLSCTRNFIGDVSLKSGSYYRWYATRVFRGDPRDPREGGEGPYATSRLAVWWNKKSTIPTLALGVASYPTDLDYGVSAPSPLYTPSFEKLIDIS